MHADGRRKGSPALRELLRGIVDYAGLFPPAGLDMQVAAENYAAYRAGPEAWALGRFVVPAGRLDELAAALAALAPPGRDGWRVAALLGPDTRGDLERVRDFAAAARDTAGVAPLVDVAELKAASAGEVAGRLRGLPPSLTAYVEVPLDPDPEPLVRAVRDAGARPKVRTGGVTAEAFPPPGALLAFLAACVRAGVPFKATAGLHHPVAGRYRLTYEREGADAPMYGYLNLLLATALLMDGAPDRAAAALRDPEARAFRLGADAVSWRDHRLDLARIRRLRAQGMVAFGSCSFREPLDDLAAVEAAGAGGAPPLADAP